MNQKSFEDIEYKIREAAVNSEPDYNEQAWLKMNLLLNKEDRKKRWFFIWWKYGFPFLFIALGLAGYWYFNIAPVEKNTAGVVTVVTTSTTNKENNITNLNKVKLNDDQKNKLATVNEKITSGEVGIQVKNAVNLNNNFPNRITKSVPQKKELKNNALSVAKTTIIKKVLLHKNGFAAIKINDIQISAERDTTLRSNEITVNITTEKNEQIITPVKENINLIVKNIAIDSIKNVSAIKAAKQVTDDKKLTLIPSKANSKLSSVKQLSKWYLLSAFGTEISGVKFLSFSGSKVTSRYGAGIGFQVNKKLSVQTGFFAGRKKYTGGSTDYHAKAGTYWSMVDIKKVDASCLVFDIPVTVRYNFVQKHSLIFYATAGISSFIMKVEDYNYHYTYNNYYYIKDKSYTGNNNLFSMLSISAGIEKKLGPQFSFLAEPYLSFPLSGVGEGSVKLYTAGLQIGLKYSPSFK